MSRTHVNVLLIEDNPGDARLITELLRDEQDGAFEVERTDRLDRALDRLSRTGVDVVLLDLGLPDSQGIDTFVRTQQGASGEPIVIISGLDDEDTALESVRAGAQDYLVKGRIEGQLLARVIRYAIARKRADTALAASEMHYRTIIENVADAVFMSDAAGRFLDANPQATVLTGYSREELQQMNIADTYVPEDRSAMARRLASAAPAHRWEISRRLLRKDGTVILVEGAASLHESGKGIATLRDVTERTLAETKTRESEQRFRELAETVSEVFFIMDPVTGLAQYVNPAYERVFGHTREHAYTTPYAWMQTIHPEDRETALAAERETSTEGNPSAAVFRILRPDGTIRWIKGRAMPVQNALGDIIRLVGVAEDITELKRTESQFLQAQKMEAVGRLAGGIAHDFNNLLTVILSYGEILIGELEPEGAGREELQEIVGAGNRATELTRQLLAFSRQQVLQPQVLDINALIANLSRMLKRVIGEDIDFATSLASDIGSVRADPGELEQVLMNLVVNARDAMPNGGKVTVETQNVDIDSTFAAPQNPVAPGPYVLMAVTDTGSGMDEHTQTRIFEPFFTTKERGKGTGLGLATVYGIVKQSDGHVSVYSEVGQGTTFKIYLPRIAEAAVELRAGKRPAVRGGGETILLVEDEAGVRKVTRTVLQRHGYSVIEADRPEAALGIADAMSSPPDLIMTDVILPGINGRRLAQMLEKKWPGIKVLFLSGYTDDAIVRHGVLEAGVAFLQKPFTPDALAIKVRQVLDATPTTPR